MRQVKRDALLAAHGNSHLLITGEPGVGKASLARFIHDHSERSPYGFLRTNCRGLSDVLLESELFGHLQGSFGGAYTDKPGVLETIPGGTLLLGDIDAMSLPMQARLLRFIETGEYQRIGGACVHTQLHVRVMATTTADLSALAAAGVFLTELYLWLAGIQLHVPPLRDRRDDIPLLVDHFAGQLAGRCADLQSGAPETSVANAMRIAIGRDEWPGNVRELRTVVERHLINEVCARRDPTRAAEPDCGLVH